MQTNRKIITVIAATAALVAGSGIAFAAWTATGSGSGSATATGSVEVTINAVAGPADLFPGVDDGDLYFTLTNDNPYAVTFTSMALGPGGVTSSDEIGCPGADNVSVVVDPTVSFTVAANSTSPLLSIVDVVSMDLDAPDECQGQEFDVPFTLTGAQSPPAP